MQKVIDYVKQYIGLISIVLAVCMLLTYSLSYFMTNSDNHRAAEMYVGELQYSISIDGSDTNILTVPSGETIVDLTLTGLNNIDTYYKLLYTSSNNAVTVKYFDKVQDTSGNLTTYDLPGSSLTIKGSKTLKLKINNASADSRTVTFKVSGGYSTNTLADVVVPSGYYQIGLATQDANTYFCHTSSALTDGLEYTADKLAYKYKYLPSTTTAGSWATSATIDSWGVQLADKTSTESFNGKLCTYIDNKPIKVLSNTFEKSKASSIDISNFNTSNVTTLANLFSNSAATTITLGNIDTSNVINMYGMFYGSSATTINDLDKINTSNVTNMAQMFRASKATALNLNNLDTSNVTNMSFMFYGSSATSLDITAFDTSKVTDMRYMFYNNKATTLNLSKLNTSNVTNMTYMFYGSEATSLDLTNFNTSKVTNMTYMFQSSKAATINLSSFNTSNVTDMTNMFSQAEATNIIGLSNFNTSKVTSMEYMFRSSKLSTIDLGNFNTSSVTKLNSMFMSAEATEIDVSSFDTAKVTIMGSMFRYCSNLKTIYASSKFVTTKVTNGTYMFSDATKLVGGNGTTYDVNNVTHNYARIDTSSTPGYFTNLEPISFSADSWNTIIAAVKKNKTSKYNVGDTKKVQIGNLGTYTLRIANISTPNSCDSSTYSETACGFVLEFEDVILAKKINNIASNANGWPATELHYYLNNEFYSMIPTELKNGIIQTRVVSGYGQSGSSNFTSTDYIYIPSLSEVYADATTTSDTAKNVTRQLDYYSYRGVTTTNSSAAIKKLRDTENVWWLRTPIRTLTTSYYAVDTAGKNSGGTATLDNIGYSPAFRIG